MGLELAALLGNLAAVGQGEHLEAAAVCQQRAIPPIELMQATCRAQHLKTRTQIEVVGVAENDFGVDILLQFMLMNGFDAASGADRHEDRRGNVAVVGAQQTGTGITLIVGSDELKVQNNSIKTIS